MIHTEFINLLHLYFPESTCLWEIEQNQVQISQRNCVKMYILGIYTNAQTINERNTRAAIVNDSSLWFLNIYYFISCQLHCSGKEILAGKVNRELNRVNLFSWMTTHIRRNRQIKKEILLNGKNISKSVLAFLKYPLYTGSKCFIKAWTRIMTMPPQRLCCGFFKNNLFGLKYIIFLSNVFLLRLLSLSCRS